MCSPTVVLAIGLGQCPGRGASSWSPVCVYYSKCVENRSRLGRLMCLNSAEEGTKTEGTAKRGCPVHPVKLLWASHEYSAEGWATHMHVKLSKADHLLLG